MIEDEQYGDRRHLEDVTNHSSTSHLNNINNNNNNNFYNQNQHNSNVTSIPRENNALIIGSELQALDSVSINQLTLNPCSNVY